MKQDIPKAYNPNEVEDSIYKTWEQSGYFTPENLPGERKEPFTISLPPPNVTGVLHLGHATMLAIEDIMIRFERMRGKKTLWLPGTDHAAIATQSKVESLIYKQEQKTRHDLGREELLRRVREYAQQCHDTIVGQCRKIGASLDWTREAYTLDATRNHAVATAFCRMYEEGLIYRGYRVINWDPLGKTTIADDEIVYKETTATLYTFRYAPNFPISISTTRPETKVGDTAVAVHPDDPRYQGYIGKTYQCDFAGVQLNIRIIADPAVDPNFGTGALGVTPAHSIIDFEMAQRHSLPLIQVIDEQAHMLPTSGIALTGKTTLEARQAIISWLKENTLLEKEEEISQSISTAERTGGIIEPLPKTQWFVNVTKEFIRNDKTLTLKSIMQSAVRSGAIKIIPERFEKIYYSWVDNLRDWNISRQIWFGQRIPAWYRNTNEIYVGMEPPSGEGWEQDPDTLDTWFSSGLWTFSTLGWPEETSDLRTYHPTSVLETGYDIIFFWVARMILMSGYLRDEIPFHTVYLHGLVRDGQGRKMTKSLGNVVDPLDMIAHFGTDALRISLTMGTSPGNDSKFTEEKVEHAKHFVNKLWNITRLIIGRCGDFTSSQEPQPATPEDRHTLSILNELIKTTTNHLENYRFSQAAEGLYEYTWHEFADWYLEIAKVQMNNEQLQESTKSLLAHCLKALLRLWHPFIPFVTEHIYALIESTNPTKDLLMIQAWPMDTGYRVDEETEKSVQRTRGIITSLRNFRSESKIAINEILPIQIRFRSSLTLTAIEKENIENLARVTVLNTEKSKEDEIFERERVGPPNLAAKKFSSSRDFSYSISEGEYDIFLSLPEAQQPPKAQEKERQELMGYIATLEARLADEAFLAKAPEKIIAAEREKLLQAKMKLQKI